MPETQRSTGFRAFVTRHDHFFTFLGALLVVAAFYTQDVKLPPLAKKTSDIGAATSESVDLMYLNNKLTDLSAQMQDGFQPARSDSPFVNDLRNIRGASHDFDAAQDDLRIQQVILGRLPEQPQPLVQSGVSLVNRIDDLRKAESALLSDLDSANLANAKANTPTSAIPGYDKLMKEALSFFKLAADFDKSVVNFRVDVTREAYQQKSAAEEDHDRWEHISEIFVVLGFAAGLLSKLLKLPALGGEAA